MNSNNQNNNQLIKIVRKRGRPRKYINNPVIIDKNIEKDLILFLPDYFLILHSLSKVHVI